MRDIHEIVAEIDSLAPEDPENLDLVRLEALAVEYFSNHDAAEHLDVWFRLFERFPESDGYGVFWSILHGVEGQPTSDAAVIASVLRRPTFFPVLMVNRILNSGKSSVDGIELTGLLRSVVENEQSSPSVRRYAERFLAGR